MLGKAPRILWNEPDAPAMNEKTAYRGIRGLMMALPKEYYSNGAMNIWVDRSHAMFAKDKFDRIRDWFQEQDGAYIKIRDIFRKKPSSSSSSSSIRSSRVKSRGLSSRSRGRGGSRSGNSSSGGSSDRDYSSKYKYSIQANTYDFKVPGTNFSVQVSPRIATLGTGLRAPYEKKFSIVGRIKSFSGCLVSSESKAGEFKWSWVVCIDAVSVNGKTAADFASEEKTVKEAAGTKPKITKISTWGKSAKAKAKAAKATGTKTTPLTADEKKAKSLLSSAKAYMGPWKVAKDEATKARLATLIKEKLNQVITKYPDTSYATSARKLLPTIK